VTCSDTSDIWITTDAAGFVIACSPAALSLLGYSARGARGRELPNMFIRERPSLSELLRAAHGEPVEREAVFRPNDRKALPVRFRISAADGTSGVGVTLIWRFQLRWPVGMRIPAGVDRRQLITVWRGEAMRCIFVPASTSGACSSAGRTTRCCTRRPHQVALRRLLALASSGS